MLTDQLTDKFLLVLLIIYYIYVVQQKSNIQNHDTITRQKTMYRHAVFSQFNDYQIICNPILCRSK